MADQEGNEKKQRAAISLENEGGIEGIDVRKYDSPFALTS
jgi:hypothetical protein